MARYIDADKLEADLYQQQKTLDCCHKKQAKGIAIARAILDRQQTADVQEVKHGKWIVRHRHEHYPSGKAYDENVCPFCKRADHNGDGIFCGYCGAKMDGKD